MKRPIGLWISAIFSGLVALSMFGNIVGLALGKLTAYEALFRPVSLLIVSTLIGLIHLFWFRSAWRQSCHTLPFAAASFMCLILIALAFILFPNIFLKLPNAGTLSIRFQPFLIWSGIYLSLIGSTYIYQMRGRLY